MEDLRKKKNDLVFVILANYKPELYGSIKRNLTGDQGLVSQYFLAKNWKSKGLMAIVTKVVIQINAKLEGEPWTLKWPFKVCDYFCKTFSASHLRVGVSLKVVSFFCRKGWWSDLMFNMERRPLGGKNVAAMVGSISDTHARYYSTVSFYNTTDELANTVTADLMSKCIQIIPVVF